MLFSTYLAGNGADFCSDIAINNTDDTLIVSGHISSLNFPIKNFIKVIMLGKDSTVSFPK
jgi:hypothetical protein